MKYGDLYDPLEISLRERLGRAEAICGEIWLVPTAMAKDGLGDCVEAARAQTCSSLPFDSHGSVWIFL